MSCFFWKSQGPGLTRLTRLYSGERDQFPVLIETRLALTKMNDQQFKTYIESQALWRREDEQKRTDKEYLNDVVSNMIKSDGGNLDEFRRWSNRIRSNATLLQDNSAAIQLMLRTTLGSLKDEIDRYILEFINLNPGKTRLEVPCGDLLSYLQRAFLPKNDVDHIREALGSLRQNSGESLRNFNRKFRDLAEQAFPVENRTNDQVKELIKSYIRGLYSKDTARSVLRSSPTSITEAMATAIDNDEVEEALQRLGHRHEEPMDISSLTPKVQQKISMESMAKQLEKMNTKIAKLEVNIHQGAVPQQRRKVFNRNSHTAEGKPICYNCRQPGHISRQCPRRSQTTPAPMDISSTLPTAGQGQEN